MKNNPLCLGITGGIGSGKSYVCHMLEERGIPVFYTDDEAKAEMLTNPKIHRDLVALIGPQAIDSNQHPDKEVLRQYISQSKRHADRVNAIVHPRVRARAQRWLTMPHHRSVIAIECALLFEAKFDNLCDKTLTVTAPLKTRIDRICRRDGTTRQKALEWIDLQMPQEEKILLSNYTINNDGIQNLAPQLDGILDLALFEVLHNKK